MPSQLSSPLDVAAVRRDFPMLTGDDRDLPIYLDSAATSLKPASVIQTVRDFYESSTANTGRGVHWLAEAVTTRFEESREIIAAWLNAQTREVVFTSNCTNAIRLVAEGRDWPQGILVGLSEHHSNDLPWRTNASRSTAAVLESGVIDLEDLRRQLNEEPPNLVAVSLVSNALGTVQPIETIVELSHQAGTLVLVDASQAVAHRAIDVVSLDCDFLCFSGHKMFGPSGIGVLYGKQTCLEQLATTSFGGGSVEAVHADSFDPREIPWRLETGTPNIEGVLGLAAACEYLDSVGPEAVRDHVDSLTAHAVRGLREIPGVTVFGPAQNSARGPIVSFSMLGLESHALARILSQRHRICVRSGFHCAQPLHEALGHGPTVRASFALYNTLKEVDTFVEAVTRIALARET